MHDFWKKKIHFFIVVFTYYTYCMIIGFVASFRIRIIKKSEELK
ncbi:MAG TPA: hypothetical protein VEV44_10630 [Pseudoneobacillus sp.]|nr:hypothetical protein [Pseudoneobacillus sp.]